jgi:hypothetical protein
MPQSPDWLDELGVDLDGPASRFTMSPAIAIGAPESEWNYDNARLETGPKEALGRHFGDWIYDEQEGLGAGTPEVGSTGRGAAGLAAVLVFIGIHAAGGVVSTAAAMAFRRFVGRARDALPADERAGLHVSRGGAAYLAVAEIAERFGKQDPVEIEAVEEPSSIAGRGVSELSYVGVEPWVVLLRNRDQLRRYVVVVGTGGEVLGALETPMGEWEHVFLPAAGESEWVQSPPRRRKRFWKFWK